MSESHPQLIDRMPIAPSQGARAPRGRRGPVTAVFDLFSSIWLGIALLSALFLYSSIGSAGLFLPGRWGGPDALWRMDLSWIIPWTQIHVRQAPWFEMTEFEWFHWWPFELLILLIGLNITVATVRRIPLNLMHLGVWMIHTGIIILCIGSVIYFSRKIEGDAPVVRRQVEIELPTGEHGALTAIPGARTQVGRGGAPYAFEVVSIDPEWELLSGDDKGTRTYSVSVQVVTPTQSFIRQLIAGYPQYTEDVLPGQGRAIKVVGKAIVDESLKLSLDYQPQDHLHLVHSAALYLREQGTSEWIERPIRTAPTGLWSGLRALVGLDSLGDRLPRYNDAFPSRQDVWLPPEMQDARPKLLDVTVPPASPRDPLSDATIHITSYLRHAVIETRRLTGGERLDPAVTVVVRGGGQERRHDLVAFDPLASAAQNGLLLFRWVDSESAREALMVRRPPVLHIEVSSDANGAAIERDDVIRALAQTNPALEFTSIEGTAYAYRVEAIHDGFPIGGQLVSVAIVDIRRGDTVFRRWVFDQPGLDRDMTIDSAAAPGTHEAPLPPDEGIRMRYRPGVSMPPVTVVAGPDEDDLGVILAIRDAEPRYEPLEIGRELTLAGDTTLTVEKFAMRTFAQTKPAIIPPRQRDSGVRELLSMVRVEVPMAAAAGGEGRSAAAWVPYHHYAFADANARLKRFPYGPAVVELSDGRRIEMILSRRRLPLPAPVVLDDFILTTHTGGFTSDASIRDWTSRIRFAEGTTWSDAMDVSVNAPIEHGGYWYFQAQWDPPMEAQFESDRASLGRNYTVLGVGNRHGVNVQLAGCCIAVLGMIFTFYVKPILKRRRQMRAALAAQAAALPVPPSISAATVNGESAAPLIQPGPSAGTAREAQR